MDCNLLVIAIFLFIAIRMWQYKPEGRKCSAPTYRQALLAYTQRTARAPNQGWEFSDGFTMKNANEPKTGTAIISNAQRT